MKKADLVPCACMVYVTKHGVHALPLHSAGMSAPDPWQLTELMLWRLRKYLAVISGVTSSLVVLKSQGVILPWVSRLWTLVHRCLVQERSALLHFLSSRQRSCLVECCSSVR